MAKQTPTTAMKGLALFRIALGTAAWVAPGRLTRSFGGKTNPELEYMNRVSQALPLIAMTALSTAVDVDGFRERS